jgi:CBS domain-containing protein
MICPQCSHDNLPGSEQCSNCQHDLTQLDQPTAQDRVERSLMETPVSALKLRKPVALPQTATVGQAIETMLADNLGALLVVDEAGRLVGIFSERDLLTKVAGIHEDYAGRPVREFMTAGPETVREDDTLAFALHKMDVGGYRHVPLVKDGQPVGVLSVRDMLRHITRLCKNCGRVP